MKILQFTPKIIIKAVHIRFLRFKADVIRKPLIKDVKKVLEEVSSNKNEVQNNKVSIISSNCFAGRIMQDLKMEYNSPTLGLYFMYPDYIEFLQNLKYYITEAQIEFLEHSKYPIGDIKRAQWRHWYPIGLLGGKVEIHFLHYHSEQEAEEKWYRRCKRVNFDDLLIIGMDQNLCSENDIIAFDTLPFKNKIMFSTHPIHLKSNEFIPQFVKQGYVGDPYSDSHIFHKYLISHFTK